MYQWRENSSRKTRKKLGGGEETVTTYTYDPLDRLMQATYPTSTVTYTLDSVGNRAERRRLRPDPFHRCHTG